MLILNILPGLGNLYAEGRSAFKWFLVSVIANYIFPGFFTWLIAYAILSVRGWKAVKAYNATLDAGKLPHMLQQTTYARGLTDVKDRLKEAEGALGRNMAEYSLVVGSIDALRSLEGSVNFALGWLEARIGRIMAQADVNRADSASQMSSGSQVGSAHGSFSGNPSQFPAQEGTPYQGGPIVQMNQAAVQQFDGLTSSGHTGFAVPAGDHVSTAAPAHSISENPAVPASTQGIPASPLHQSVPPDAPKEPANPASPLIADRPEYSNLQGIESLQYNYTPAATFEQPPLPSQELASAQATGMVSSSPPLPAPSLQSGPRFCTNCGASRDPNYSHCLNCGKGAPG